MEDLSYHDLLDEWITNFFKWCSQGGRRNFHEDMAKLEVACERLSDDQKIPLFLKPNPQEWRDAIGEAVVREEMGVVDIMLSSLTPDGFKKLLLHHTEAILHTAALHGMVKMFKFIFKFMEKKLDQESVMEVLEHKCLLNGTSVMLNTIIGYGEEKEKAQIIDIILDHVPSYEQRMSLLKTELRVTGTSAIHEAVIRGLPDVVLKLLQRLSHNEQREILALETRYGEMPADLEFHHKQIPEVYRPESCQQKLNEVGQLLHQQHKLLELQSPDRNNVQRRVSEGEMRDEGRVDDLESLITEIQQENTRTNQHLQQLARVVANQPRRQELIGVLDELKNQKTQLDKIMTEVEKLDIRSHKQENDTHELALRLQDVKQTRGQSDVVIEAVQPDE